MHDLENHDIAVTKDCMLYQGYVTRFLDRKTYENPYIGQNAYRVQISNTGKELSEKTDSLSLIKTESDEINAILQMFDVFSIDNFENHMCAPEKLADARARLEKADAGLAAARKNPEYIEIRNTRLNGDIALSTETLKGLEKVEVCGDRVITIENMTSFHDCDEAHALVIYLGGFHNHIKREFLKKVYRDNQDKSYLHFGDIDAGGFYIYEHLCRKTGIPFAMMNMGIEMLEAHKQEWNKLTVHDAKRLEDLKRILDAKDKAGIRFYDYRDTINFMINNKCKIEQEQLQELYDL